MAANIFHDAFHAIDSFKLSNLALFNRCFQQASCCRKKMASIFNISERTLTPKTTKMVDNLIEKISSPEFNHEKFVKELSQRCVGGQELQQQRKTIQGLSESTNVLLKKNVYKNYMQFIETAKEITHLESEMYQLSHLLTEQKSLLEVLANTNILGDPVENAAIDGEREESQEEKEKREEEDRLRVLTSILKKVEGCTGLLDVKDRVLLFEGDLLELDPVENTPQQRTHAYLFTDALMLTSRIANRRGPGRYKMYAMYDLNSLAVVNVRDLGPIKMAFKILAYPDTRLFQCANNNSKKEWLEHFDQAKKTKLVKEQAKREASMSQSSVESPSRTSSIDSPTLFEDEAIVHKLNIPDLVLESPEELDVLIAERHFENALKLLMNCDSFIKSVDENEKDPVFLEIRNKIESRRKKLIKVLMDELEVSPDKSLQGGLRAARRAVRLLNALNKSTQACDLMLKLCTSIMKKELKCVKREGATVLYVKQFGNVFYCTLLNIAKEFRRVFPNSPACNAALVVWTNSELTHFMAHVIKQIFVPQSSITTISECVASLRTQNAQLCDFGLDLRYQVDGLLHRPIMIALQDAKDKLTEAIKHRSAEEKWRPMNLQNKNNLNKFVQELSDLGLPMVHSYVKGDCWLDLTSNTVAFTKLYMTLLEDCLRLYSSDLHFIIEDVLHDVFHTQLRMFQNAIRSHNQDMEVQLIDKNLKFIIDHLLNIIESNWEASSGVTSAKLTALGTEFGHLKIGMAKPKPAPRQSIPKYTTEEFI